ncbi:MAG: sulfatase [Bryobacteraceae bacterium]|nr:sulfatase [Bryobacteraceae bacterium]
MKRRAFLRGVTAGAGAVAGVGASAGDGLGQETGAAGQGRGAASGGRERQNVIWLVSDQHRGQALSSMYDPNVRTPNADVLAKEGVHFTHAVSGFPLCCPFRGSMLTGRYPHHCVPGHERPLPDGQQTIAHVFNGAGYRTAYFGKWHLSGFREDGGRAATHIVPPEKRGGFETWTGYENNNSPFDSWVHGGSGKDAFHYRLPGYETDELTGLFVKYLRERATDTRPFFAVLSVQPPHDPYVAPEEYMRRFHPSKIELRPNVARVAALESQVRRDLAGYYAMIENWDDNVGRVRRALAETGLAERTHIVYFSDHGDMHGSHGQFRKTCPWEESIRIPLIVSGAQPRYEGWENGRWPAVVNHVDLAPTTLGLCGIAKPSWMEGFDYSGYRRARVGGRSGEPDSAYLQCVIPTMHHHSVDRAYRGLVTRDGWKLVCFEGAVWLLFNLNEDPYETANLAHNSLYRAERKKLVERLRQWVTDTDDRFSLPSV